MSDGDEAGKAPRDRAGRALVGLALVVIVYFTEALLAPILVAVLLKIVLAGACRRLRMVGVPASLAAAAVVLSTMAALSFGLYHMTAQVTELLGELPDDLERISETIEAWRGSFSEVNRTVEAVESGGNREAIEVRVDEGGPMAVLVNTTWEAVAGVVIVGFLLFFLLAHDDLFLRRLVEALPAMKDKRAVVRSAREIERRISTYLVTVTLINACLGAAIGLAMWLYGMPNPLVWGVFAAVLNFIPYAGAMLGAGLVLLVSIGTYDAGMAVALPPATYFLITALEGNVLTPIAVGHNLALNPTAVFLSVLVWGFMWGFIGVLLAVPLLITARVILESSDQTKALGQFLAR